MHVVAGPHLAPGQVELSCAWSLVLSRESEREGIYTIERVASNAIVLSDEQASLARVDIHTHDS